MLTLHKRPILTLLICASIALFSVSLRAQTKSPAVEPMKYIGPGSCAATSCHGSVRPVAGSRILQTEYSTWTAFSSSGQKPKNRQDVLSATRFTQIPSSKAASLKSRKAFLAKTVMVLRQAGLARTPPPAGRTRNPSSSACMRRATSFTAPKNVSNAISAPKINSLTMK